MTGFRTVVGVELLRVGAWDASTGPFTCTPQLIAEAVRAGADSSLNRAVVKLGHTDPRYDGTPAFGQVTNLRASADGNVLLGDLVNVPAWLVDGMPSAYPHRSVEAMYEVVAASGQSYDFVLTGLALLGAAAPAVSGLAPVAAGLDIAAAQGARQGRAVVLTASRTGAPRMAEPRNVTPVVRQVAAARGVDLSTVVGTGVGGRITKADVIAASSSDVSNAVYDSLFTNGYTGPAPASDPQWPSVGPAGPSALRMSRWMEGQAVPVDPFGRNPLVEDARLSMPGVYAAAAARSSAPTLFASGDLPPFTASGVDPQVLLRLPWFLRHAAASAPEREDVLAMIEDAASPDEVDLVEMSDAAVSDGAQDYQARVTQWLQGPGWVVA